MTKFHLYVETEAGEKSFLISSMLKAIANAMFGFFDFCLCCMEPNFMIIAHVWREYLGYTLDFFVGVRLAKVLPTSCEL